MSNFKNKMAKRESKISVRTPGELYKKISNRAYDLGLHHREYFLCLAIAELGLVKKEGEKGILTPEMIKAAKQLLVKMDGKE